MSTPAEKSAEVLNRGQELHQKGLFDQATRAYFEALKLAPADHAPLASLAAVQYELGNYTGSALYSEKALRLLGNDQEADSRREELHLRLAKSYALSRSLDNARNAVAKLAASAEREALESSVALQSPAMAATQLRTKVLDEVPRTKPAYQNEPEYCAIGLDNAEAAYDDDIALSTAERLSWMFAGVGDARNFYRTLIALPNGEARTGRERQYHFTLVDLNPAVFARNLISLELLSDLDSMLECNEALTCLIYVFVSQVMPPFAYTKLQEAISSLLQKLEDGNPVNAWVYVPESQRPAICHHLRLWQQNLRGKYTTKQFRLWAQEQALRQKLEKDGEFSVPPGCQEDDDKFDEFGIMMPNDRFLREHESELKQLLEDYSSGKGTSEQIEDYVDQHWKLNVTLVDLDFDEFKDRQGAGGPDMPAHPTLVFHMLHPGEVEDTARAAEGKGFMACFEVFFRCVAFSLDALKSRLTVEVAVSEMNDYLERLRYDVLPSRQGGKQGTLDPSTFPKAYDRIHLSNIPDYVGGALSSFIYATPALKPKSSLSSSVLLNNSAFEDYQQFLAEYTLLGDTKSIEDNFRVQLRDDSPSFMDWEEMEMSDYTNWTKVAPATLSPANRMSRSELESFIHRHLLKVLLPYPRDPDDIDCVYTPLNPTIIFRLVAHLHYVGYPAHWLSDILERILQGTVATTVRAPRQAVEDPGSVSQSYPSLNVSLKPWLAEMTTLSALWQGLLPFGLLFEKSLLPALSSIREYHISFPPSLVQSQNRPHFMLVFWNEDSGSHPGSNLRDTLLDDENGDGSEKAKAVRESGVRVLMTYRWATKTRMASFWLRSDEVETMRGGNWSAAIWRSDTWNQVTPWVVVSKEIVDGEQWAT
ncbi:uncharacterized protein JN550_005887 [Neoarthrinium moseri]|uniref:uncharacterized protein n=1 Tax=Neoarthrinium moseri TaxID=1658444 RepID=UPI001FDADEA9|nr:uncharacterized protein JN550_005887 [Neoarthrinium moseri]KAI1869257.1 hypothetical protein JN550_005887 [Neoarthrinium moseri]